MKINMLLNCLTFTFCVFAAEHQLPENQNWDGKAFYKATKQSLPFAQKVLDTYPLASYESILDVGCGSGTITAYIAKKVKKGGSKASVAGFDPSETMIKFAQGYYQKPDNLYFCQYALPKIFNKWDFICTINMFHLIPLAQQVVTLKILAECAQTNKAVPLVIIMAAKSDKPKTFERAYAATLRMPQWEKLREINLSDYFQPHDTQTFAQITRGTGWEVEKIEIQDEFIRFKNCKSLKRFIRSWMGGFEFVAQMSKKEQKQLIRDLIKNYSGEEKPTSDGSIVWSSPRLIVHAQKQKAAI